MTRAAITVVVAAAVSLGGCGSKDKPPPAAPADGARAAQIAKAKREVAEGKGLLGGFCAEQLRAGKLDERQVTDCLRRAYDAYKDDAPAPRGATAAP